MASIRVKLNKQGVRQLLTSAAAQADLDRRARRIAAAAGPGFEAESTPSPARAHATVVTGTTEARIAEATDRALTRAIDAGRG
jgi:hypothetical protein